MNTWRSGFRSPLFLIILAQAVLIPLFVGVDVPYRDEWDSIIRALVLRAENGFQWNQLLLPVVEHRLPLPMALFQLLSQPRYYPQLLMIVAALIHVTGWLFFRRYWLADLASSNPRFKNGFIVAIIALVYFHWAQLINYTMGVQVFWVLGPVGTIIFICGLSQRSFKMVVLGHVVSVFSFPTWPIHFGLFFVFLLLRFQDKNLREHKKLIACTSTLLALTGLVTFGFLYKSAGPGENLDVLRMLRFALYVVASPLSRYKEYLAWFFGPLFFLLWIYVYRKGALLVSREILVLSGVLTVLSALLIAYGRHLYDYSYAFGGHYLLLTAPGWCIVLLEAFNRLNHRKIFFGLASALVIFLGVMNGKSMKDELKKRRPGLILAQACLVERREDQEDCRKPLEEIFLNGYEDKLQLAKKARELGIYP